LRKFLNSSMQGAASPLFVYGNFLMGIIEDLRNIIATKLTDSSQFLVDVVVKGQKGPQKVLVVIDGDRGVTIDDCANLSRELSKAFDETQLFAGSYMLEVSTPGLDQPLKLKRQYHKNIGRAVKVVREHQPIEGKLTAVMDETITIEQEISAGKQKEFKTTDIPFSQIEKTYVLISFK
jgi:ribosome maturation factor RimP